MKNMEVWKVITYLNKTKIVKLDEKCKIYIQYNLIQV